MDIKINKEILNDIIEEQNSDALHLERMVDEELSNENANFDLVDDCVDAILEISGAEEEYEIPKFKLDNSNKKRDTLIISKVLLKIAVVAAIILATTFTANAAVKGVTNKGIIENISIAVSKDISVTTTTAKTTETTIAEKTIKKNITKKKRTRKKNYKKRNIRKTTTNINRIDDGTYEEIEDSEESYGEKSDSDEAPETTLSPASDEVDVSSPANEETNN